MKIVPKILLVKLPPWDPRVPPLGAAYLATYLKSKNINVKVFDLNIEMYHSENNKEAKGWGNEDFHWWQSDDLYEKYLPMFDFFVEKILSFNIHVIGFSATLNSTPFLNLLLKSMSKKSSDKVIIVGGPATFFGEARKDFNAELIDYFVIGDGEIPLYELLSRLRRNGRLSFCLNSSCKIWKDPFSKKGICVQAKKNIDLDNLPYPTFEEFNLSSYRDGNFILPIIFSKGCTRCCTFCSDTVLSRPYRCRKAKNVVEEIISHLIHYKNITTLRLNDLSFNANLKFIDEFCDRIISEGINVKFYGQAQVRPDTEIKLLRKMKKAGFSHLELGLESFSDSVLFLMRKNYGSEEAIDFLRRSKEAGLENRLALIVGYPGETEEDFNFTLKCIRQNRVYIDRICSLNICGMPVGSELRRYPGKYGYFLPEGSDWVSTDYTNTYIIRKKRYNDIIACCDELDIKVDACLDLEIFEKQFAKK